jgi:hypothetical protein
MLDFANNLRSRTSSPLQSSLAERLGLAKKYVSLSCWIRSVANNVQFSAYGFQQPSKKLKTSPTKTPSTPKRSSSSKTMTTPKNKASAFKSMLETSMPMTDSPKPIIKSPNGKPKDAVVRVKFVDEDEELDDWEPEMGGDKQ